MAQAWYNYPVGLAHGQGYTNPKTGEMGIDLGMPLGTPITALYAGKCTWAGLTDWGGGRTSGGMVVILCNVPDVPNNVGPPYSSNPTKPGVYSSYYMHLDTAAVKEGDDVAAGQLIGTSGGQNPGQGGHWPTSPGYSNFLHIEFGFNAYWVSGPGRNIDPTWAIDAARKGTLPGTSPDGSYTTLADTSVGGTPSTPSGNTPDVKSLVGFDSAMFNYGSLSSNVHKTITQPSGWDGICTALQNAQTAPDWNWRNLFGSFFASVGPWTVRWLFIAIGLIMAIFVVWEWVHGPAENVANMVRNIPGGAPGAATPSTAITVRSGLEEAPTALAK